MCGNYLKEETIWGNTVFSLSCPPQKNWLQLKGMSYMKLFTMKVFWLVSGLKGRTLSWRKLQKDVDLSTQMWPGCHLGVTISRLPCQRNLYRHISFDFTKEPQIFDQVCFKFFFHFIVPPIIVSFKSPSKFQNTAFRLVRHSKLDCLNTRGQRAEAKLDTGIYVPLCLYL